MTAHSEGLTVDEVEMTKALWIKHVHQLFVKIQSSSRCKLVLDCTKDVSGVLRCSGRIQN